MGKEDIGGINMDGFCRIEGANPTGQSEVWNNGKWILIVRPLSMEYTGLAKEEEIKRRRQAVADYLKGLPQYCQKSELVVLQGSAGPVLARFTEALSGVKPVSDLDRREVFENEEMCIALAKIN